MTHQLFRAYERPMFAKDGSPVCYSQWVARRDEQGYEVLDGSGNRVYDVVQVQQTETREDERAIDALLAIVCPNPGKRWGWFTVKKVARYEGSSRMVSRAVSGFDGAVLARKAPNKGSVSWAIDSAAQDLLARNLEAICTKISDTTGYDPREMTTMDDYRDAMKMANGWMFTALERLLAIHVRCNETEAK